MFLLPRGKTLYNIKKFVSFVVFVCFLWMTLFPSAVLAQSVAGLPIPGTLLASTPSFTPLMLRGIQINPKNPFEFNFLLDTGTRHLSQDEIKTQSETIAKYFLSTVTIPEEDLWVNLSPYEKDRIVPEALSQTDMGRDLLAQDYILKQLTASLIHPDDETGKVFWEKVYKKAYQEYGTTNIPVNTFNKVWIVPDKATVYQEGNRAFVAESYMKVMVEEDFLARQVNSEKSLVNSKKQQMQNVDGHLQDAIAQDIVREVLIPLLEKEVNEGKLFSQLRQMYHSMILATWYKQNLKGSIINKIYADQSKVKGVETPDPKTVNKIYDQYLEAFEKGVCDIVKVEYDPNTQKNVPRKYFSGGFAASAILSRFKVSRSSRRFRKTVVNSVVGFVFMAIFALSSADSLQAQIVDRSSQNPIEKTSTKPNEVKPSPFGKPVPALPEITQSEIDQIMGRFKFEYPKKLSSSDQPPEFPVKVTPNFGSIPLPKMIPLKLGATEKLILIDTLSIPRINVSDSTKEINIDPLIKKFGLHWYSVEEKPKEGVIVKEKVSEITEKINDKYIFGSKSGNKIADIFIRVHTSKGVFNLPGIENPKMKLLPTSLGTDEEWFKAQITKQEGVDNLTFKKFSLLRNTNFIVEKDTNFLDLHIDDLAKSYDKDVKAILVVALDNFNNAFNIDSLLYTFELLDQIPQVDIPGPSEENIERLLELRDSFSETGELEVGTVTMKFEKYDLSQKMPSPIDVSTERGEGFISAKGAFSELSFLPKSSLLNDLSGPLGDFSQKKKNVDQLKTLPSITSQFIPQKDILKEDLPDIPLLSNLSSPENPNIGNEKELLLPMLIPDLVLPELNIDEIKDFPEGDFESQKPLIPDFGEQKEIYFHIVDSVSENAFFQKAPENENLLPEDTEFIRTHYTEAVKNMKNKQHELSKQNLVEAKNSIFDLLERLKNADASDSQASKDWLSNALLALTEVSLKNEEFLILEELKVAFDTLGAGNVVEALQHYENAKQKLDDVIKFLKDNPIDLEGADQQRQRFETVQSDVQKKIDALGKYQGDSKTRVQQNQEFERIKEKWSQEVFSLDSLQKQYSDSLKNSQPEIYEESLKRILSKLDSLTTLVQRNKKRIANEKTTQDSLSKLSTAAENIIQKIHNYKKALKFYDEGQKKVNLLNAQLLKDIEEIRSKYSVAFSSAQQREYQGASDSISAAKEIRALTSAALDSAEKFGLTIPNSTLDSLEEIRDILQRKYEEARSLQNQKTNHDTQLSDFDSSVKKRFNRCKYSYKLAAEDIELAIEKDTANYVKHFKNAKQNIVDAQDSIASLRADLVQFIDMDGTKDILKVADELLDLVDNAAISIPLLENKYKHYRNVQIEIAHLNEMIATRSAVVKAADSLANQKINQNKEIYIKEDYSVAEAAIQEAKNYSDSIVASLSAAKYASIPNAMMTFYKDRQTYFSELLEVFQDYRIKKDEEQEVVDAYNFLLESDKAKIVDFNKLAFAELDKASEGKSVNYSQVFKLFSTAEKNFINLIERTKQLKEQSDRPDVIQKIIESQEKTLSDFRKMQQVIKGEEGTDLSDVNKRIQNAKVNFIKGCEFSLNNGIKNLKTGKRTRADDSFKLIDQQIVELKRFAKETRSTEIFDSLIKVSDQKSIQLAKILKDIEDERNAFVYAPRTVLLRKLGPVIYGGRYKRGGIKANKSSADKYISYGAWKAALQELGNVRKLIERANIILEEDQYKDVEDIDTFKNIFSSVENIRNNLSSKLEEFDQFYSVSFSPKISKIREHFKKEKEFRYNGQFSESQKELIAAKDMIQSLIDESSKNQKVKLSEAFKSLLFLDLQAIDALYKKIEDLETLDEEMKVLQDSTQNAGDGYRNLILILNRDQDVRRAMMNFNILVSRLEKVNQQIKSGKMSFSKPVEYNFEMSFKNLKAMRSHLFETDLVYHISSDFNENVVLRNTELDLLQEKILNYDNIVTGLRKRYQGVQDAAWNFKERVKENSSEKQEPADWLESRLAFLKRTLEPNAYANVVKRLLRRTDVVETFNDVPETNSELNNEYELYIENLMGYKWRAAGLSKSDFAQKTSQEEKQGGVSADTLVNNLLEQVRGRNTANRTIIGQYFSELKRLNSQFSMAVSEQEETWFWNFVNTQFNSIPSKLFSVKKENFNIDEILYRHGYFGLGTVIPSGMNKIQRQKIDVFDIIEDTAWVKNGLDKPYFLNRRSIEVGEYLDEMEKDMVTMGSRLLELVKKEGYSPTIRRDSSYFTTERYRNLTAIPIDPERGFRNPFHRMKYDADSILPALPNVQKIRDQRLQALEKTLQDNIQTVKKLREARKDFYLKNKEMQEKPTEKEIEDLSVKDPAKKSANQMLDEISEKLQNFEKELQRSFKTAQKTVKNNDLIIGRDDFRNLIKKGEAMISILNNCSGIDNLDEIIDSIRKFQNAAREQLIFCDEYEQSQSSNKALSDFKNNFKAKLNAAQQEFRSIIANSSTEVPDFTISDFGEIKKGLEFYRAAISKSQSITNKDAVIKPLDKIISDLDTIINTLPQFSNYWDEYHFKSNIKDNFSFHAKMKLSESKSFYIRASDELRVAKQEKRNPDSKKVEENLKMSVSILDSLFAQSKNLQTQDSASIVSFFSELEKNFTDLINVVMTLDASISARNSAQKEIALTNKVIDFVNLNEKELKRIAPLLEGNKDAEAIASLEKVKEKLSDLAGFYAENETSNDSKFIVALTDTIRKIDSLLKKAIHEKVKSELFAVPENNIANIKVLLKTLEENFDVSYRSILNSIKENHLDLAKDEISRFQQYIEASFSSMQKDTDTDFLNRITQAFETVMNDSVPISEEQKTILEESYQEIAKFNASIIQTPVLYGNVLDSINSNVSLASVTKTCSKDYKKTKKAIQSFIANLTNIERILNDIKPSLDELKSAVNSVNAISVKETKTKIQKAVDILDVNKDILRNHIPDIENIIKDLKNFSSGFEEFKASLYIEKSTNQINSIRESFAEIDNPYHSQVTYANMKYKLAVAFMGNPNVQKFIDEATRRLDDLPYLEREPELLGENSEKIIQRILKKGGLESIYQALADIPDGGNNNISIDPFIADSISRGEVFGFKGKDGKFIEFIAKTDLEKERVRQIVLAGLRQHDDQLFVLLGNPGSAKSYSISGKAVPSDSNLASSSVTSDVAAAEQGSLNKSDVGGIDLNAQYLDLKTEGIDMDFELPLEWQGIDLNNVPGLVPVFIQIMPVMNFPAFVAGEEDIENDNASLAFHQPLIEQKQDFMFEKEFDI